MIGRITQQAQAFTAQRNLQATAAKLAQLQNQGASGKKFTRPSQDPVAAADALTVRSAVAAQNQYARNIDDANAWMTSIDSALRTSMDLLHRARDLVVQGSSDTNSTLSREAIAVELEALRGELLTQAQTQYLGRPVFAGTSDQGAYDPDYTYTGVPGAPVQRRVGDNETIRVDLDGPLAFGDGPASVFATLDRIAADLRAGGDVAEGIADISDHMDNITTALADVGARHGQILRAQDQALDRSVALDTQLAGIEDIDLAELLLDLEVQRTAYQASLGITAQTLPLTLMDFLR